MQLTPLASTVAMCLPVQLYNACLLAVYALAGKTEPEPFDEAVLERFAKSLVVGSSSGIGGNLVQLRQYVLATCVVRCLMRSHVQHVRNERLAVNAVRFVQASICVDNAVLPSSRRLLNFVLFA